jgi:chemotaxis protein methyltransferase CheR
MAFTYFFRDLQSLKIAVNEMFKDVGGKRNINIWDAGCASGEEPFTVAILLAEKMNPYGFKNVKIYATDIDISNQFGEIIKTGIYPYEKLKRIPANLFSKYFQKYDENENYQIMPIINNRLIFRRENLLTLKPVANDCSLIICKNVLLHQSYQQRIDIVKMFHSALSEKGVLVMEHTQKLPNETNELFTQVVSNAQVFRKNENYQTYYQS